MQIFGQFTAAIRSAALIRNKIAINNKKNAIYDTFFPGKICIYQKKVVTLQRILKTLKSMEESKVKECEQVIIDFAKKENMSPDQMMSDFQTALLNIAGWICECYRYSNDQYEAFMKEYAANVTAAVERRFRKE